MANKKFGREFMAMQNSEGTLFTVPGPFSRRKEL